MAINKKLIHFKTRANFDKELAAKNILDTSICFIKDTKQIWTHGEFYNAVEDGAKLGENVIVDILNNNLVIKEVNGNNTQTFLKVINGGATIGSDVVVEDRTYIGPGVIIGSDVNIEDNVNIYSKVRIGGRGGSETDNVIINDKVLIGDVGTLLGTSCVTAIGSNVNIGVNNYLHNFNIGSIIDTDTVFITPLVKIGLIGNDPIGGVNIEGNVSIEKITTIGEYVKIGKNVNIPDNWSPSQIPTYNVGKNSVIGNSVNIGNNVTIPDNWSPDKIDIKGLPNGVKIFPKTFIGAESWDNVNVLIGTTYRDAIIDGKLLTPNPDDVFIGKGVTLGLEGIKVPDAEGGAATIVGKGATLGTWSVIGTGIIIRQVKDPWGHIEITRSDLLDLDSFIFGPMSYIGPTVKIGTSVSDTNLSATMGANIGAGVGIGNSVEIKSGVKIGKNVKIPDGWSPNSDIVVNSGGLFIKNDYNDISIGTNVVINSCTIGSNVKIGVHGYTNDNVAIGERVYIGSDVRIPDGLYIPDGWSPTLGSGSTLGSDVIIGTSVTIGNNVSIGSGVSIPAGWSPTLGSGSGLPSDVTIGTNVKIGNNILIGNFYEAVDAVGDSTTIGTWVHIRDSVTIGRFTDIDENVQIDENVRIGDNTTIGMRVNIPDNWSPVDREELKKDLFIDEWNTVCGNNGKYNSETGYFELNGLTDITYEQAVNIKNRTYVNVTPTVVFSGNQLTNCRTNLPPSTNSGVGNFNNFSLGSAFEILNINSTQYVNTFTGFLNAAATNLRIVKGVWLLHLTTNLGTNSYWNCPKLEEVKFKGLKCDFKIHRCPKLNYTSIKYLIDEAVNTSAITIDVHSDIYSALTGIAEYPFNEGTQEQWQQLLIDATEKQITFATA